VSSCRTFFSSSWIKNGKSYALEVVLLMPTPKPSSSSTAAISASRACAAACLAFFFEPPFPTAVNTITPQMKQNQQDYGVWEVKSCRLADCTNKEQVNVSPCL